MTSAPTVNGRIMYVRSVVQPEPDLKMLAKVYMQMAMRDIQKEKEEEDQAA